MICTNTNVVFVEGKGRRTREETAEQTASRGRHLSSFRTCAVKFLCEFDLARPWGDYMACLIFSSPCAVNVRLSSWARFIHEPIKLHGVVMWISKRTIQDDVRGAKWCNIGRKNNRIVARVQLSVRYLELRALKYMASRGQIRLKTWPHACRKRTSCLPQEGVSSAVCSCVPQPYIKSWLHATNFRNLLSSLLHLPII